jgi:archaellum component FlaC
MPETILIEEQIDQISRDVAEIKENVAEIKKTLSTIIAAFSEVASNPMFAAFLPPSLRK